MIVAPAQITPQIVSAIRGPNLSATQPPLIWNNRYVYAKAEKDQPGLRFRQRNFFQKLAGSHCRADVHAIEVREEVHQTQETQDDVCRLKNICPLVHGYLDISADQIGVIIERFI
jgi:hypothetical protein